ncbi:MULTISPECIES: AtzE family amidohydrolase [unclassified Roseitalea]|uniref:AtzE family amidohydrolase n=1 Tax=unclassified Roseitalea TaxID=2639107 RepID=UPI00273ED353|nr:MULTISPECIES: AtzE family amidohydrolase [unclassified Roseitalea]
MTAMAASHDSARAIAADVAAGRIRASAVVERALDALARARALNAVTRIHADRARDRAAAIDARRDSGEPLGALAGVPFAAKDLFNVAGHVTGAGSRATDADAPAERDADAIARLEAAGAILLASTTMDELAYGFTGECERDGATVNPRRSGGSDAPRVTGGSSSGSAALVAAGIVPVALGSDTNGSVRVPAALCGIAGLKPTYGRLSRGGTYPFVDSLDHVGPLAANVADLAVAYDAMQGLSDRDPVQARRGREPVADTLVAAGPPGAGRLGGFFVAPLHADVRDAVDAACDALGARQQVELPLAEAGRAAAFVITNAEGGALHRSALASRPDRFGPLVRDRLRAGALLPASWVSRAQKLRRMLTGQLIAALERTPVLIAPATPCPAFPSGTERCEVDGRSLAVRLDIGLYTQALTLTGVPIAVVTTIGRRSGLPVGVQVVGRPFREDQVLAAAAALERAGFAAAPEPLT